MMLKAALLIALATLTSQTPRMDALVDAVRPVLPFPGASSDGELPADNSAESRWFVVWPAAPGDRRIVVKANPLHPDIQKAGAEAMDRINAAVVAAERRAQEAYDKAMEQMRRTGKGSELEVITLDDEGIAGERIDAELQVVIELQPAESFAIESSEAPVVSESHSGVTWSVSVGPNTYRRTRGDDRREHFRAAEMRLYFGPLARPDVRRDGDEPRYRVNVTPSADSFAVVIRGNDTLVRQIAADADWSRLAEHRLARLRPTKREG
ncbi:MAG TPA: hypothetical protein VMO26_21470 [Vicinamibacterales bacterium]|nr:hypothetical protein [Vicinamibacterales bacterium]